MSTLRVTTVTNPSGGQPTIDGLARAWVNFNGTGTVAIRASLNVSSITDNGTGDYTVNFTTALADANYAAMGCYQYDQSGATAAGVFLQLNRTAQTASAVRITTSTSPGVVYDGTTVTVAVFR
jgi:hypothetical protein